MISYKYWKLLQENLDVNLGVRSPTNLGLTSEAPMLGMMFKKMKGTPDAGEMGMGMGKPPMGKPGMGDPGMGDDADGGEEEGGNDDSVDDDDAGFDDDNEDDDENMDDDDDSMDDDDDEEEEDGEDKDQNAALNGPNGPPKEPVPSMMKRYMKKEGKEHKALPGYYQKTEKSDAQTKKSQRDNSSDTLSKGNNVSPKHSTDKPGFMAKEGSSMCSKCSMMKKEGKKGKCSKCSSMMKSEHAGCSKCSMMKKEGKKGKCSKCSGMTENRQITKEQASFLSNLQKMTGGTKFEKDELGFWQPVVEDYLIEPENRQPGPGEVGFAPSQNLGLSGAHSQTGYQEWLGKRKNK